jgi:WD40 repeat protein
LVASTTGDRERGSRLRLWDPATGAEQTFLAIPGEIWTVALTYTPDGARLLSSGGDGVVRLWDPTAGAAVREFRADPRGISDIAVSSDGRWIATAGDDGAVKVWDSETPRSTPPGERSGR